MLLWRRKKTENEKIFFAVEKKNREGKGGKYLEKENTCTREEDTNREGKGGKYSKESDEIQTYVCTEIPLLDFCKKGRVKSVKINLGRAHY